MKFERKKGFRIFGLDKQKLIKYFFGGNASLAILVMTLICVFLFKEAYLFFPGHHEQLKTYRKAGLEYFTWVEDAYQQYKIDVGGLNRVFQHELQGANLANRNLMAAYSATRLAAEREIGDPLRVLRDAIKQRKDVYGEGKRGPQLDVVIERLKAEINEMRPGIRAKLTNRRVKELKTVTESERLEIVDAVMNVEFWERGEAEYYDELEEVYDDVESAEWEKAKYLNDFFLKFKNEVPKSLDAVWSEASEHARSTRDRADSNELIPKSIFAQVNVGLAQEELDHRQKKFGAVLQIMTRAEFFDEYARVFYLDRFSRILKALKPDGAAYAAQPSDIREKTDALLAAGAERFPQFMAALENNADFAAALGGINESQLSKERAALLQEMSAMDVEGEALIRKMATVADVFVDEFPFEKEAETIYALTPRYRESVDQIRDDGRALLKQLPAPEELTTELAREEMSAFRENFATNLAELERIADDLEGWRYDKPWRWHETVGAFFFGSKWTNNSQIQDRYGIIPMFLGSLVISVIALIMAVPIAIAAAIYVNQIAGFKEQSFVKPTIEFIGAIPSVVLGFLGIVVVGELLKIGSEWPIFSWLPGFPIDARLNMLTAGLLLAFMAIPIIFTLAEDALNNVPSAYRDGSLSLGANPLQTAFRVILPASLSGVIAAVLLGFGRVIGETMVVLLVAGNRINIPDFSKGIGVVTEPSHTMTGIIAQGLGEAAKGSVDYRALFMVGLVLFVITLIINYVGQKIISKHQAQ